MKKRWVVFDAEFNGLRPDRIWCITCKDIDSNERFTFRFDRSDDWGRFSSFSNSVVCWIGHNILQYDVPNINKLLGRRVIDWRKCIDTLVISRLIHYLKKGGHSLENWGRQFGMTKEFVDVWDDPDLIDTYVERCEYDVEIQHQVYNNLRKFIWRKDLAKSIRVEHDLQQICHEMHVNGFAFNKAQADEILDEIKNEMSDLEERIVSDIPPVLVQDGPVRLKRKKNGEVTKKTFSVLGVDNYNFKDESEFHRFHYEPFNPGSAKQRIAYLNSIGWQPTDKTKGHLECERELNQLKRQLNRSPDYKKPKLQEKIDELEHRYEKFREWGWKVNETNLDTLPTEAPEGARLLARWLTLEGRRGDLEEWRTAYDSNTGRIHGQFNGIGSWSHRMSHVRPNQGNIFSNFTKDECKGSTPSPVEDVKLRYNGRLRSLWRAAEGAWLVGTDAEGIQMRVLAHYVDDPEFTEAIVNGRKEDGTDVHSLNMRKLGQVCRSRADSKTFIYAWLLGAGTGKVAEILGCSLRKAGAAVDFFIDDTPGLAELKRYRIPSDARRGYFDGLDGRKVICRNEHLVLAGYLQNGEKVVMAHANVKWKRWAEDAGVPYKQVDFVHDEWVCECPTQEAAEELGKLQTKAIEETGVDLGLNCALAGEYKIGKNWLEVH